MYRRIFAFSVSVIRFSELAKKKQRTLLIKNCHVPFIVETFSDQEEQPCANVHPPGISSQCSNVRVSKAVLISKQK